MEHWVAFPKLGIELTVPQSIAQFTLLGIDFDIRFYGFFIALGLCLAVAYGYRRAPQLGIDRDKMLDVVLVSAVVAVLCTRLYYVLFSGNLSYYLEHPEKILAIWDGGLAIYGGIIGAFVSGFILCRVKKVSALSMFDLAAVGFLIGQGLGRWGNFFNQEAYGSNTDLPWGMTGDIIQSGVNGAVADQTAPVHPTFLYESLWCLLGALVLHIMFKTCYRFKGQIFASYLIWYGTERMLVEGLRSDSLMLGQLRVSQWLSAGVVILGIVLLFVLRSYHRRTCEQETEDTECAFANRMDQTQDIEIEEEHDNGENH